MIPKRDVVELDIPVEEAMKMVISGGAFAPESLPRLTSETEKPARTPSR